MERWVADFGDGMLVRLDRRSHGLLEALPFAGLVASHIKGMTDYDAHRMGDGPNVPSRFSMASLSVTVV